MLKMESVKSNVALAKYFNKNYKYLKYANKSFKAPKINCINRKDMSEKYFKKLTALKAEFKNVSTKDEKYAELSKQIEDEQKRVNKMLENVVEIDKFEFVNELIKAAAVSKDEDLENAIFDPELRGLISIMNSTIEIDSSVDKDKKKEEKKKAETEMFKKLVKRFNFESSMGKKQIVDIFLKNLQSESKFKTKIFNNAFEAPEIIKDGKVAMSGITSKSKAPLALKDYLKNTCKYFDEVLKAYIEGKSEDELREMVLDYELSDARAKKLKVEKVRSKILKEYQNGPLELNISGATKEVQKEFKLIVKRICQTLKSVDGFIKHINKYDKSKLEDSYEKYEKICKSLNKIIKSFKFKSDASIEDHITEIIKVLAEIKKIDEDDKLYMIIFKDFINDLPSKLSNKTKNKMIKCIEEGETPKFVEQASKNEFEFTKDEFKYLDSPDEELYDKSIYAKFGTIEGVKLSKSVRVALGLRIVSEIKSKIAELKTNSITLIC